jgi:hypothetical protein
LVASLGLPAIIPAAGMEINGWWSRAAKSFAATERKKANSLIMLALRALWLERNARIFEGRTKPMATVLNAILEEWRSWLACRGRGRHRGEIT